MDSQYDPRIYDDVELDYRTPRTPRFGSRSRSRSASPADLSQSQQRSGSAHREGLPLLQLSDWSRDLLYDEFPPTCIYYSIEWKLLLNKGRLSKLIYNPEQVLNLVLAPGVYWATVLKAEVDELLK